MQRQRQNEIVCAQNLMISWNDEERKRRHRRWWTNGSDYERWRLSIDNLPYFFPSWRGTFYSGVGFSFIRQILPEISFLSFHTQRRRKSDYLSRQNIQIDDKSGLTMTVNTGRLRQAINNLLHFGATWDNERHEYVSAIVVAAVQEEKSTPKVLHVRAHD